LADRDNFKILHKDDFERNGNWLLARRSLDLRSFGLNMVEIAPGESIPEHDETGRDQEEVFFIVSGDAAVVIDGTEHPAPAGTLARVDPELRRTVVNSGDETVTLMIASAPRSSGYEPMGWA
jgi:mannose-6-phosphate isomerase-like protein (cupin superfamily)